MSASPTQSLADLFALFDGEPPAGAGSAAALSGAVGAALLMTVARMRRGTRSDEQGTGFAMLEGTLRALRERLVVLAEQDREAYARLLAAYRLPGHAPVDQAARRTVVLAELKAATGVPLQMMGVCQQILTAAASVAKDAPVRARGEVAVGVELVGAAFDGAGICVAANLPAIADAAFVADVSAERGVLEDDAAEARETIRALLGGAGSR